MVDMGKLVAMITAYELWNDPKREKRVKDALRAKGYDRETANATMVALSFLSLPPEEQENQWRKKKAKPEFRVQRENEIYGLMFLILRDPDLRHAWINDAEHEAEIANWMAAATSGG